ncbi:MAG: hypothetical protein ACFFCO_04860, partial [Promethearchaeota archaeon]
APQIHNGQVTWQGWDGSDNEIYLWNGISTTQLTINTYDDLAPQIHNGQVTWYSFDGSDNEIFLWNGISITQLTSNAYNEWDPQIHNGQVTWSGFDGIDDDVFFTPDQVPPVIDHPEDVAYELGTIPHTLTWQPSDIYPSGYRVTRNNQLVDEDTWNGGTITVNIAGLAVGYYIYTCEVWDRRGNHAEDSVVVVVYEAPLPPTWLIAPTDQHLASDEALDYTVVVFDVSGIDYWTLNDTTNFALSVTDIAGWGSTAHLTNASTLALGAYGVNLTAYDVHGLKVSGVFTVTVFDASPPTWVSVPSDQIIEFGSAFSYDLDATDASGLGYWEVNDSAYFVISGGGVITNRTTLPVGVFGLRVTVYDIYKHPLSGTFTVHVQDTTPPIWLVPPTDQTLNYGEALDYQVTAWDLSGIATWSINDTSYFAIDGSGRITGIATLEVDTYGLNVTVIDPYGNQLSATFSVTVVEVVILMPPLLPVFVLGVITVCVVVFVFVLLEARRKS